VADKIGVPQSTLSEFLESCDTLNTDMASENRRRKCKGKWHAIYEVLLVWFKQASSCNAPINCSILLQKKVSDCGGKLDFKVTNGRLTRRRDMALFMKNFMEDNSIKHLQSRGYP
jgi:hypothetical protein